MSNVVDFTHYGGFQSYSIKPITTSKPGITNHYQKDAYKDISNYNKRKVSFYDDKVRWNSVYDKDVVKSVNEKDYKPQRRTNADLLTYEYSHDEILKSAALDARKKNEDSIRERSAQSTESFARKKMHSHWGSTYDLENEKSSKIKNEQNFQRSTMPEWFKPKYHNYHTGTYKTDHTQNMGIHGDNPRNKFNQTARQLPIKYHNDNYEIGLGTAKSSGFIPGYSGQIPVNQRIPDDTLTKDPYFKVAKTNHMLNYKSRIPNYSGYVPMNSSNIKGNTRPNCLSTQGESFA